MERITLEKEDMFHSPEIIIEDDQRNHEVIINGYINQSSDEEQKKLHHLRAIVQAQNPSCKETDNSTLKRFLRARDLDVEKASTMLMKYLTWRQTFVPKGFISNSEVNNDISQNKVFLQGTDKKGRPIAVIFGAKHFPRKGGLDEFKRAFFCSQINYEAFSFIFLITLHVKVVLKYSGYVAFALDKLCSRIPDEQEKFTVIVDFQGYAYSNTDARGYIAALSILQDYYPERLDKLFFIYVPYIFMTVWKIIYPFIDKNTKKKIIFVENKKLKDTLMEEIEESQLPEIYGGKLQLVPIQDA